MSALCPQCGSDLPDNLLAGLCPKCVARVSLGPPSAGPHGTAVTDPLAASDPPSPSRSPQPAIGRLRYLGDYELLEEIARGGMGVVYKARQVSLNRIVAVKMILTGQFARPEDVQRFRAEAEAAANLKHPNIVAIHEVGEHEGQQYFSMDFIEGQNLAELVGAGPLPAQRAARYVQIVAEAIHFAHQRGTLHRDLKPSNILIDAHDQPQVTDFGLAKRIKGDSDLTVTGQVLGSPNFMPPEQACGKTREIGTTSDVYGLGAILYYLLTARPPFTAETVHETLMQVLQAEPAPLRLLNPSVPRDLETICLKCLQKNGRHRYGSAQELAEELGHFLKGEPVRARPVGQPVKIWRWCRRHPAIASLTAAVVLVFLIGFLGVLWQWRRANLNAELQFHERQRAEGAEKKATDKLWDAYLAQGRANRRAHDAGRRFGSLAIVAQAAEIRPSLELRNEAIACLTLPDLRVGNQWVDSGHGLSGLAFNSTFDRCAVLDEHKNLVLRRTTNGDSETTQLAGYATNEIWGLRFSPDDRWLAVICRDRMVRPLYCQVWDLNREEITLTLNGVDDLDRVDFSPDSRLVAAGDTNGTVVVRDLASGQLMQTLSVGNDLLCVRFDPSSERLAISKGPTVGLWEVKTGKALQSFRHAERVWALAWHPSGTRLATGCEDSRGYVWDIKTGQTRAVLAGHQETINYVAFSHAGDLLATSSWDYTLKLWDPFTGSELVTHPAPEMNDLKFSREDRLLAYAVDPSPTNWWGFGFFEVAAGRECRVMRYELQPGRARAIPWIGFSPDGCGLAVLDADGLRLWDAARAQAIVFLPYDPASTGTGYPLQSVAFHPSGGLLVSESGTLSELPLAIEAQDSILKIGKLRQNSEASDMCMFFSWIDQQGDQFAVACQKGHIHLLDEKTLRERARLAPSPKPASVALSPDGQWVAVGDLRRSAGTNSVRLFRLPATNAVQELPVGGRAIVRFSPNGKWLAAAGVNAVQIFQTGTFQPVHRIPAQNGLNSQGICAFSPDSKILALADRDSLVRLLDAETAQELATLQAPNPQALAWLAFSPDGSQLGAACLNHQIQLWDLRAIRAQLVAMKLDWNSPLLPAGSIFRTTPLHVIQSTNAER